MTTPCQISLGTLSTVGELRQALECYTDETEIRSRHGELLVACYQLSDGEGSIGVRLEPTKSVAVGLMAAIERLEECPHGPRVYADQVAPWHSADDPPVLANGKSQEVLLWAPPAHRPVVIGRFFDTQGPAAGAAQLSEDPLVVFATHWRHLPEIPQP